MLPNTDKTRKALAGRIIRVTEGTPELNAAFQIHIDEFKGIYLEFENLKNSRRQLEKDLQAARKIRMKRFRQLKGLIRRTWSEIRSNLNQEEFDGQLQLFHYTNSGFLPEGEAPDSWLITAQTLLSGISRNDANGYPPLAVTKEQLEVAIGRMAESLAVYETLDTESLQGTAKLEKVRSTLHEAFRIFEAVVRKHFHAEKDTVYNAAMRKYGYMSRKRRNLADNEDPDEESPDLSDDPDGGTPPDDGPTPTDPTTEPPLNPDPPAEEPTTPSNQDKGS